MATALIAALAAMGLVGAVAPAHAAGKPPNILVIFADDVGAWNLSGSPDPST